MNHLNLWEESIRQGLEHHKVTPPAMGWEKLEQALNSSAVSAPDANGSNSKNTNGVNSLEKKHQARPLPLLHWRWSAVGIASAAVAASVAIVMVMNDANNSAISQPVASHQQKEPYAEQNRNLQTRPDASSQNTGRGTGILASVADEVEHLQHKVVRQGQPTIDSGSPIALLAAIAPDSEATPAYAGDEAVPLQENEGSYNASQTTNEHTGEDAGSQFANNRNSRQSKSVSHQPPHIHAHQNSAHTHQLTHERRHMPHFALHMSTSNSQMMSQKGTYYNPPVAIPPGHATVMSMEQFEFAHIVGSNLDKQVESRVKHHTPFTAGLQVSIPMNRHWSLRTGLTYTLLSTDIQAGSQVAYYTTQQRLHYVGIPVAAGYAIYASRYLDVYGNMGMLIENCVKATRTTTFDNTDQRRSSQSKADGFANGLWQVSANVSAGVQLNITRNVGIYFEPGVSYFIPDGSSLPNVRHEHPWNFNMQGGLRFTIE